MNRTNRAAAHVLPVIGSAELFAMLARCRATGGDISALPRVSFDLVALMRRNKVTIAALAKAMRVTMTRVRYIRNTGEASFCVALDYLDQVEKMGEAPIAVVSGEFTIAA